MTDRPTSPLQEGVDFYREGLYTVFTEAFLRRRGYCCESGCRHCPWAYRTNQRTDTADDSLASSDEPLAAADQ